MPLISIITINYNNAIGLQKTVDSVISQTYKEFEFIIIDGASTDNSKQIIENNLSNISYWISEKDNGIYDAQNKGILKAKGNYYLFLNSGDVLSDKLILEKIVPFLSSNKSFYYGNLLLLKDNKTEKHLAPKEIELDFLLNSTFWHPCVFIKSELFKQFGLYNTSFDICGDYEFFIRCLLKPNITTQYLNEFITLFDGNGISNDTTKNNLQNKERELAWKLNVSEIIYDSLKKQNSFSRSKYASVINSLQKIRGKSNF
jgi:glycosyltransferase involved in cell wall biosynthesis